MVSSHVSPYKKRGPKPKVNDPEVVAAFWSKVDKDGPKHSEHPDLGQCWLWTGTVSPQGYGQFFFRRGRWFAHRYAYRLLVGPISYPHVEHVCHSVATACTSAAMCKHRRCVNPAHLEAVPHRENARRRSGSSQRPHTLTCPEGHPWTDATTLYDTTGARVCRPCIENYCVDCWVELED